MNTIMIENMDILIMNKLWIDHGYNTASRCREDLLNHTIVLRRFECLDVIGLFETCWMIYEHHNNRDRDYGYPSNE